MSRFTAERDVCGGWSVYYKHDREAPPLSHHKTPKDALDAISRYEDGDLMRGRAVRSGADIINDLVR